MQAGWTGLHRLFQCGDDKWSQTCVKGSGKGLDGGDGFGATPFAPVLRVVIVYSSSGLTISLTLPVASTTSGAVRFWKTCSGAGLTPAGE